MTLMLHQTDVRELMTIRTWHISIVRTWCALRKLTCPIIGGSTIWNSCKLANHVQGVPDLTGVISCCTWIKAIQIGQKRSKMTGTSNVRTFIHFGNLKNVPIDRQYWLRTQNLQNLTDNVIPSLNLLAQKIQTSVTELTEHGRNLNMCRSAVLENDATSNL